MNTSTVLPNLLNAIETPEPVILWHGKHLDCDLSIVSQEDALESDTASTLVSFVMQNQDVVFKGQAEITPNPAGVASLLKAITLGYLEFIEAQKDQELENGHHLQ